ncbi:winged helix-turn-helix domain-containing protein [Sulfurisphaera javensis]|uniref:Winged helix-turn-helix domain-containing protein n=1 Tax=Sulfurisphaera javensis TaxID=2049879 RepID=A0AAT9GPT2_9CREN
MLSELKIKIIKILNSYDRPVLFKDIKDQLNISTDALKRELNDLIKDEIIKRERGRFVLTQKGKELVKSLES